MIFYTPGHGIISDTLIMHGIVRILSANNIFNGKVKRIGERYEVHTVSEPSKNLTETFNTLYRMIEIFNKSYNQTLIQYSKYLSKIDASNIDPSHFKNWIDNLYKSFDEFNILLYSTPDHKEKNKEGRKGTKNLFTTYLPLSFIYGKYLQESYMISEKQYKVCSSCFVLNTLGLIFGTTVIVHIDEKGNKNVILLTLSPSREMEIEDILVLQRLLEKKPLWLKNDLPIFASILYILSLGETLYALQNDVDIIVWKIQKTVNFQRANKPISINVTNLINKITDIKYNFPEFPRFINDCLINNDDGILALNDLALLLLYGGDEYYVLRELSRILEKNKCNYRLDLLAKSII